MTAMPCGRKKHSNTASQSHRGTGPLVAIEETVLRLRTATTNNSAKSHRPNSRRRALVELALTGQPKLSFMVGGRFETCGICCPRAALYQETRLYSTSGSSATLTLGLLLACSCSGAISQLYCADRVW